MESLQMNMDEEVFGVLESLGRAPMEQNGDAYWRTVLLATQELMRLRDSYSIREALYAAFQRAELRLFETEGMALHEDLVMELEAILIGRYPMHDFWTSSFEHFVGHNNFKRHWR